MTTFRMGQDDPLSELKARFGTDKVEQATVAALGARPNLTPESDMFPHAIVRKLMDPKLDVSSSVGTANDVESGCTLIEWEDDHSWPSLDAAALHGVAGEVAMSLAPHTEADQAAILATFLAVSGNWVGQRPHARVGAVIHPARLFTCIVGQTARSRKGQSFEETISLFRGADPAYVEAARVSGLSSGEGLVAHLNDANGCSEKRALIYEPEFSKVLAAASRDGSTLSAVIRDAWDSGNLRVLTRKDPLHAKNTHISIVTHITEYELALKLASVDIINGFANRFLFVCARRSQLLPNGGELPQAERLRLVQAMQRAFAKSQSILHVSRSAPADALWANIYLRISDDMGFLGAVTARAEAQMLRLQALYAILDGSQTIEPNHVRAAEAFWRYSESSCLRVFGNRLQDPAAETLLRALRDAHPDGLTGTKQRDLFGRHMQQNELEKARGDLEARKLAFTLKSQTRGRPMIVTYAVPKFLKTRPIIATIETKAT